MLESIEVAGFSLGVTVSEPAEGAKAGVTIIYLHGGGLLFGQRDDLPRAHLVRLTGAGHRVVALDYPLAPETKLPQILDVVEAAVRTLVAMPELGCAELGYVLFGRSAGGYLALQATARLVADDGVPGPAGVMDFYGYPAITDPKMARPSAYYSKLAPVSEQVAMAHVGGAPTSGSLEERFLLYVYGRQQGRWMELIGAVTPEARAAHSLVGEALAQLPPVFACAGTADQDVPFSASRELRQKVARVTWLPVYDGEHDFDRDPSHPGGIEAYAKAIVWLETL